MTSVSDSMRWAMDRGDLSLLTLIDLSRCFDVVDHEVLLSQLQLLQIDPGWFQSYLTNHQQQVRIPGTDVVSSARPINIGVFQGSCMGPLLFNIAALSLSCYVPEDVCRLPVKVVRYADDTQVLVSGPRSRLADMQRAMERVLDTLGTYFMQSGMCVNASKTELLFAGGRQQLAATHRDPSIQFMGATVQPASQVKNLGLIMDSNLTYEPHIDSVIKRCNGILIGLLHARHVLSRETLPVLVNA